MIQGTAPAGPVDAAYGAARRVLLNALVGAAVGVARADGDRGTGLPRRVSLQTCLV